MQQSESFCGNGYSSLSKIAGEGNPSSSSLRFRRSGEVFPNSKYDILLPLLTIQNQYKMP